MNAVARFLKGFRTILAALSFLVVGLLSAVGSLDLTPVVAWFVKDPALLGVAMVGVGALFGFLRYLTDSPVLKPHTDETETSADRPRASDPGE